LRIEIADWRLRLRIADSDCGLQIQIADCRFSHAARKPWLQILRGSHRSRLELLVNQDFAPGTGSALNRVVNPKALALQARTRAFADRVIKLCEALPPGPAANSIRDQLLDSSGSADSNYRAACRARTRKEFIAKLGVVVEEADESLGWLLLLIESSICANEAAQLLVDEANELVSIFVKSEKTAKRNYEAELNRQRAARRRKSR
jgi:four helix bundle protein